MRGYVVLQHTVNYMLNHSVKIRCSSFMLGFLYLIYKNLDHLICDVMLKGGQVSL
jgi:hypothetical protein